MDTPREPLLELYDRWELHRQRRADLLNYGLIYLVALMIYFIGFKVFAKTAVLFSVLLVIGIALSVSVGLMLLAEFIRNEKRARLARLEIHAERRAAQSKRKNKRKRRPVQAYYVVGDDGELIETVALDERSGDESAHLIRLKSTASPRRSKS